MNTQAAPSGSRNLLYRTSDLSTAPSGSSDLHYRTRDLNTAPSGSSDLHYRTRDLSTAPSGSRDLHYGTRDLSTAPSGSSDLHYGTRDLSTAPSGSSDLHYRTRDLNPLLQLRTCDDARSVFPRESRPLVLLFGWLGAKPRGLDRYRDIYTGRGYDVLTVQGKLSHFTWPPRAVTFTHDLLTLLLEQLSERRLVVHAFSVGAYLYAIFLLHLHHHPDRYGSLRTRIIGQVYDSIVYGGLDKMATGVAEVSPLPSALVKSAAMAYFALTRRYTVDTYNLAIDTFLRRQVAVPTLLFYCENDTMSRPDAMQELVQYWRQTGVALQVRSWRESRHAGHLIVHREEYLQTLGGFLDSLPGLTRAKL